MPRTRTTPVTPVAEVNTTNNNKENITMAIVGMDKDFLSEVMSSSRTRGVYDAQIREFFESDEVGGKVDLEEGIFKGKKPQTIKAGFENAKEKWLKLADCPAEVKHIEIRNKDGQVYLVRSDLL